MKNYNDWVLQLEHDHDVYKSNGINAAVRYELAMNHEEFKCWFNCNHHDSRDPASHTVWEAIKHLDSSYDGMYEFYKKLRVIKGFANLLARRAENDPHKCVLSDV